jgi:hypothetical protein
MRKSKRRDVVDSLLLLQPAKHRGVFRRVLKALVALGIDKGIAEIAAHLCAYTRRMTLIDFAKRMDPGPVPAIAELLSHTGSVLDDLGFKPELKMCAVRIRTKLPPIYWRKPARRRKARHKARRR